MKKIKKLQKQNIDGNRYPLYGHIFRYIISFIDMIFS